VEQVAEFGDPIKVTEEKQTKVGSYVVNTVEVDSYAFCGPQCLAHYLTSDEYEETAGESR
jgi:hypothetical protein